MNSKFLNCIYLFNFFENPIHLPSWIVSPGNNIDILMQEIPSNKKLFTGGDLNTHMAKYNIGFKGAHKSNSFGNKNEEKDYILEFSMAYNLVLANT